MFYTATGTAPLPVSSQVVVLYDRKSGAITHMHQALFFSTSRPPQEKERLLTELVKRLAKEINPTLDLQAYEVLHVPDFELGHAEYTVDVGSKQLTEIR